MPALQVGETATTTLALVVHELATNSIKYGALSTAAGTLDVVCTSGGDEVVLNWTERGGPPPIRPTGAGGFGSRLLTQSVAGQLGGSIAYEWPDEGAIVTLRMSKARITR